MNRRNVLGNCLALLPVPAFVKASSLWLPKEKAFIKPKEKGWAIIDEVYPFEPDETWDGFLKDRNLIRFDVVYNASTTLSKSWYSGHFAAGGIKLDKR